MKMTIGTEVGLDPSNIVLDGDLAPPPKIRAQTPLIFAPCLLWRNGWMDQDITCYGDRRPGDIVLEDDPSPPPQKKGRRPSNFRPMRIVAKRLDASGYHLVRR